MLGVLRGVYAAFAPHICNCHQWEERRPRVSDGECQARYVKSGEAYGVSGKAIERKAYYRCTRDGCMAEKSEWVTVKKDGHESHAINRRVSGRDLFGR